MNTANQKLRNMRCTIGNAVYNTNLSEQSPRYTEALINGLDFGGSSDVTNIVTSSCHCQAREGFVMAYPLIMLERLWSKRSKIMTAVVYRVRLVILGFERRRHGDDFKDRS